MLPARRGAGFTLVALGVVFSFLVVLGPIWALISVVGWVCLFLGGLILAKYYLDL